MLVEVVMDIQKMKEDGAPYVVVWFDSLANKIIYHRSYDDKEKAYHEAALIGGFVVTDLYRRAK